MDKRLRNERQNIVLKKWVNSSSVKGVCTSVLEKLCLTDTILPLISQPFIQLLQNFRFIQMRYIVQTFFHWPKFKNVKKSLNFMKHFDIFFWNTMLLMGSQDWVLFWHYFICVKVWNFHTSPHLKKIQTTSCFKDFQTNYQSPFENLSNQIIYVLGWKLFRPLTSHHMKSFQTGQFFLKFSDQLPVTIWKPFRWWQARWWQSERFYHPQSHSPKIKTIWHKNDNLP